MLLSLIILAAPIAQDPPLAWLAGEWCTEASQGKQTCERWAPMAKGEMRGVSEIRRGTERSPAETMRITDDAGMLVFHAEPRGQAPADFQSTVRDHAPSTLTFENRTHDYPQRVRYWREGEMLMAEISLADGSRPMRWTFHRVTARSLRDGLGLGRSARTWCSGRTSCCSPGTGWAPTRSCVESESRSPR